LIRRLWLRPERPGPRSERGRPVYLGHSVHNPNNLLQRGQGLSGEDDPFLSWLYYILDDAEVPQTISISYTNYEKDYSVGYARALCSLFGQLGACGVSILIAIGDWGVGQDNCVIDGQVRFKPTFPASCPWVTSVGGTSRYDPEFAAELSRAASQTISRAQRTRWRP